MKRRNQLHPVGHVLVPAAAIGALSVLLAVGLSVLGILDQVDQVISHLVSRGKAEGFPKSLPEWLTWLVTVTFAFGLSFAMLNVAGTWRRIVLWITSVVLLAAWAPVLSLAAHAPDVGAPWIASLWSGICALVYASKHRMPCDRLVKSAEKIS